MRVRQHFHQPGHDGGEAGGELSGSAVRHGPQELSASRLCAPGVLFQRAQEGGEDEFNPVAAEVGHDDPGRLVGGLAHVLVPVSEAQEQVWEEVHHVGLKQPSQHAAQGLKRKQRALAVLVVFLVPDGLLELLDHAKLLEGRYAQALHYASQAVG